MVVGEYYVDFLIKRVMQSLEKMEGAFFYESQKFCFSLARFEMWSKWILLVHVDTNTNK